MATLIRVAGLWLVSVMFCAANAADCPQPPCFTRPPELLVGFAPGGMADRLARELAKAMQRPLGQNVIVNNMPGASGNLAAAAVAKSAPDSHTILLLPTTGVTVNGLIYKQLPFELSDLAPVSIVATLPYVLAAHPSTGATSLRQFADLTKQSPGKWTYASSGVGSTSHLLGEQYKLAAGVDLTHVPNRGGGPAAVDLSSGQVNAMFLDLPSAKPLIESGKVRPLAITGTNRSKILERVPTFREAGVAGFETGIVYALMYPRATDARIVNRLASAVRAAQQDPAFRQYLDSSGLEVMDLGPDAMASYLKVESMRWTGVVRAANIKAD